MIFCGRPSSRMSKSSAVRFVTCFPWASVTTASTWTRFTLTRRYGLRRRRRRAARLLGKSKPYFHR